MGLDFIKEEQARLRRARPFREKIEELKGWLGSAFIALIVFCCIFGPLVGPRTP